MNILINSACNSNCKFCFEPSSFKNLPEMTVEMFKDIVDWLCYSYRCDSLIPISMLGGEPTLHSRFGDMLNYLASYQGSPGIKLLLITNGAQLLEHTEQLRKINSEVLLNCNAVGKAALPNILSVLVTSGIPVVPSLTIGTTSVIDEVHRLGGLGVDRVRMAAASGCGASFEDFYKQKDTVLDAYAVAASYGMQINMDCCKIPTCIFSDYEKKLLRTYNIDCPIGDVFNASCSSNADILPNGKLIHCMPLYTDSPRFSYYDFNNALEVYRYTNNVATARLHSKIAADSKCYSCDEFQKGLCSAGCLGMSVIKG